MEKGTDQTLSDRFGVQRKEWAEPWFGRFGVGIKKKGQNPGSVCSEFGERNGPNPGSADLKFGERTWLNPDSEFGFGERYRLNPGSAG